MQAEFMGGSVSGEEEVLASKKKCCLIYVN